MHENEISYKIRGLVFKIHKKLGPGLMESVYEEVLFVELLKTGLEVKRQVPVPVIWDGVKLDHGFRADLVVENKVIIELKSVENIAKVHHKILATYVKLSGLKLGMLINFFEDDITAGITRYINGTL
ncbi:MAG: GxxExxY protein [Bacteroidales bacterium]|nr:GxxExxY protein [Bacteroidales bacterium]